MADIKYYYAIVSLGENPGQILLIRDDKKMALSLSKGQTRQLPPNANIQLIREIKPEAVKKIKEELINAKHRDIQGIINF